MASIPKFEAADLFGNEGCATEIKTLSHHQPLHWHNFFELEYITDGDGEYIINGASHKIQKNTLFLSTPSDFHELRFGAKTSIINIQFLPEILNPEIYHMLKNPIVINDSDGTFTNYLMPLCNYGPRSHNYNKVFVEYLLNATLFLAATQYTRITGRPIYRINDYFHKAVIYINEHFDKELSLTDIAKNANLTPEYMSRLFKKHSGQRLSDYIISVRMSHARNLVINTSLSINEIALSSGYNSPQHFIREFKKKFGSSPSNLRKEQRCK